MKFEDTPVPIYHTEGMAEQDLQVCHRVRFRDSRVT